MTGRQREGPEAGEAAEREYQPLSTEPTSKPPPGFLGFLDNVLGSEAKTRRLGYLVWQFAGGISFILIALAGLWYIMAYKAAVDVKVGISLGSVIMVATGGLGLRHRRAKRLARRVNPAVERRDDESPARS